MRWRSLCTQLAITLTLAYALGLTAVSHATSTPAEAALAEAGLQALEENASITAVLPYEVAVERLNPAAISAYEAAHDVSAHVATERLAFQTMVPNLSSQLADALGENYGQLWFDNDTGEWVVEARSSGATAARELMDNDGLAAHYRFVSVAWNAAQLESFRTDVEIELGPASSVGIAGPKIIAYTPGPPTPGDEATAVSSRQKFAGGEELAEAPEVELVASPGATTAHDGEEKVKHKGEESHSLECGTPGIGKGYCSALVGGDHWTAEDPHEPGYLVACTLSYWVSIKDREPKNFPSLLTAGHCIHTAETVKPTSTCEAASYPCNQFGLTLTYFLGEGYGDAGLIDYYSGEYGTPTFPILGGYWNWWDSQLSALEYYRTKPPAKGQLLCGQGYHGGSYCAEVEAESIPVTYGGVAVSNLIQAKVISGEDCDGDSGGPWDLASTDTAVGINDAGQVAPGECDTAGYLVDATSIDEAVKVWKLLIWGFADRFEPW